MKNHQKAAEKLNFFHVELKVFIKILCGLSESLILCSQVADRKSVIGENKPVGCVYGIDGNARRARP